MKETLALIEAHDAFSAQSMEILALRDMSVGRRLVAKNKAILTDRGFDAVSSHGKELWLAIQRELGPATEAALLLRLCEADVRLADFLVAYEGAGSIRRAVEIVTAPKPKPSPVPLPINWRN
jgi:hypothetical protein